MRRVYLNFNGDNVLNVCAISGQFDLLDFFKKNHSVEEVLNKQGKTVKDFLSVSFVNSKNPVDFKVKSSFSQVTSDQFDDMMESILRNKDLIDAASLDNIIRTVKEIIEFKNYAIWCSAVSELDELFKLMNQGSENLILLSLLSSHIDDIMSSIIVPMIKSEHQSSKDAFALFSTLIRCQNNHWKLQSALSPYLEKKFIYFIEKKYNEAAMKLYDFEYDLHYFLIKTRNLYQYFSSETHKEWYRFFMSKDPQFNDINRDYLMVINGICFPLSSEETLEMVNHVLEKTKIYPKYEYKYSLSYYLNILSNHSMSLELCKNSLSDFSLRKIFSIHLGMAKDSLGFIRKFPRNEWPSLYEIYYNVMIGNQSNDKDYDPWQEESLFKVFMYLDNQGMLFDAMSDDMLMLWSYRRNDINLLSSLDKVLLNNITHYFQFPNKFNTILKDIITQNPKHFNNFKKEMIYQYSHGNLNLKSSKDDIQEQVLMDLKTIQPKILELRHVLVPIYLISHNEIFFAEDRQESILNHLQDCGSKILSESQRSNKIECLESLYMLRCLFRFLNSNQGGRRQLCEQIDFHAWWRSERFDDLDKFFLKETRDHIFNILKSAFPRKPNDANDTSRALLISYQPDMDSPFALSDNQLGILEEEFKKNKRVP